MSASIPTTEPAAIRVGDTAAWQISLPDYPAGAGWALEYTLLNAAGKISFTSVAEGDAHRINVLPAVTSTWAAGAYQWQCRVADGTNAFTVRSGQIDLLADFSALVASDQRSHAEKTLAALEAWIENHDPAVAEYEIAGRRMKYIAIADLLKLRDAYRREVRGRAGKSARIYLRF